MEEIRTSLATKFHLKGPVKMAFFNPQHVYLDFFNETNYNHILFKNWIHIGESAMKVLKWSPDFNRKWKPLSLLKGKNNSKKNRSQVNRDEVSTSKDQICLPTGNSSKQACLGKYEAEQAQNMQQSTTPDQINKGTQ
ncbi:hypothetical protein HAX54_023932 [Datura stramonium]|uniref:DUF4283 domain-containing protein n=1 Tax=Datura stramonium TaxID=4076 RepID=A0ABS8UYL8_DATST|nr:hypothetical protein [Datura stramonium]